MADYADKRAFIELMFNQGVLRFGEFTLKSGRRSPYFFNLGAIGDCTALAALGEFYAEALVASGLDCDVLFGPAYKGIPIAVAAGIALARRGIEVGVAFDRKETKDHGEGGMLVGAGLAGRRVVLVDDVITDGATKEEGAKLIAAHGGDLSGLLIALDRQEKLDGNETAFAALRSRLGVPVRSIATLEDVIAWLDQAASPNRRPDGLAASIKAYRDRYCILND